MIEAVIVTNLRQEVNLNKKEMKKLLVGLSIAGLIAGAGLSMTGCATPWGGDKQNGAGSIEMEQDTTTQEAPAEKLQAPVARPNC